jgi:transcriptional/translational regulatory protein YebC/TACO1
MFDRRSVFTVAPDAKLGEERLLEVALDAGADDLVRNGDTFEIHGDAGSFVALKSALERAGVPLADAGIAQVPRTRVPIAEVGVARRVVKLLEALDEHDDVQNTYANYDISDDVVAQLANDA